MKSLFGNLVYCLFLFVSDVYGTYRLNGFDPLQVTAQSYAQRRNLARPPLRTLDPSGVDPCAMGHDCEHICVSGNASYRCTCRKGYILNLDQKTCALKQVKVVVVEDPCKCAARLAFQMQTQAALQEITARLADMTGRVEQIENILGPV